VFDRRKYGMSLIDLIVVVTILVPVLAAAFVR
jgi:Tfp pilus assembly protein PilE